MLAFTAPPQADRPSEAPAIVLQVSVETEPVESFDDAADDPAIWVHPTRPDKSLVLGTDKKAGLAVYDLDGKRVQFLPDGRLNNVDLRDGFVLAGGRTVAIAAATQRDERSILLYSIDAIDPPSAAAPAAIVRRIPGAIETKLKEPYGVAMYRSPVTGAYYVFATDKDGAAQQFRLTPSADGGITGESVREFHVGSIAEGMVADDANRCLYVSEEQVALWKYPAEPDDQTPRLVIDIPRPRGNFAADAEGLAILSTSATDGWVVLSSQGDNSFSIFRRLPPHEFVGSFTLAASAAGIDGVSDTDGIDISPAALGAQFPQGLMVVQDGDNAPDPQNFKFVSLANLLQSVGESKLHR